MTIGELRAALAELDPDANVLVLQSGAVAQVADVVAVAGADFVVLRGKSNVAPSRKLSTGEQGLIGRLVRLGAGNALIAAALGRPEDRVKRAREKLGF